ncbi:MAG: GntR family transcriptional regulator [Steroidobacteraceae bacterium]
MSSEIESCLDADSKLGELRRVEDCSFEHRYDELGLSSARVSLVTQTGTALFSALTRSVDAQELHANSVDKYAGGTRNTECAYERIKSRLRQLWKPGELLQIGRLAAELRTSSTPVREALTRLAAERVISYVPGKGFFSKIFSKEEVAELYLTNQMCILTSIGHWPKRSTAVEDVEKTTHSTAMRIAKTSFDAAELFAWIAALSGIDEIVSIVANINDRLHQVREAEKLVIDSVDELAAIDVLSPTLRPEKISDAVRQYHAIRLQRLPLVYKELLSMSYEKR